MMVLAALASPRALITSFTYAACFHDNFIDPIIFD